MGVYCYRVVDTEWSTGGKGIGRLTLCGPREAMWTQAGEMMNGGIVSGKEVIYVD